MSTPVTVPAAPGAAARTSTALRAPAAPLLLIADDDEAVRHSVAELLTQAGYRCETAATAADVCDQIGRYDFDLIIADIVMPGNAELELVRELSAIEGMPPLLLVTGHPSIETATKAVEARVVGYLTKPIDPAALLKIVAREVDVHQSRRFIRRRRQHLEGMLDHLRTIEHVIGHSPRADSARMMDEYLPLLTDHILTAVADLRTLVGVVAAGAASDRSRRELAQTRPFLLLEALRDAVAVLERTKRSFKSKELAELRRRLESLLATT